MLALLHSPFGPVCTLYWRHTGRVIMFRPRSGCLRGHSTTSSQSTDVCPPFASLAAVACTRTRSEGVIGLERRSVTTKFPHRFRIPCQKTPTAYAGGGLGLASCPFGTAPEDSTGASPQVHRRSPSRLGRLARARRVPILASGGNP